MRAAAVGVFITFCLSLCGCWVLLSGGNDILSVRERADEFRSEMTKKLGDGFIAKDIAAVKGQFCRKSQEIEDIEAQIAETFAFIDGSVVSYRQGSRGYEGYGAEYGEVTDYEFDSTVFMITDTGKEYLLTFRVQLIAEEPITGMTAYTVHELHIENPDYCRAGYYWVNGY